MNENCEIALNANAKRTPSGWNCILKGKVWIRNDARIAKLGWEHKEEKNFLERANYVCERICCVGALNEKMLLCDKTVLSVVVVVVVLPNCCLGYHTSEPYAVSRIIFEQSYDFLTRDLLRQQIVMKVKSVWMRRGWFC